MHFPASCKDERLHHSDFRYNKGLQAATPIEIPNALSVRMQGERASILSHTLLLDM